MEVKVIGEPCGFNGPYTFYKGLQITPPSNCNNILSANGSTTTTRRLPNSSSISPLNKNKTTTRKCVIDRRNENNNNYNIGLFKPLVLAIGDFIPVKPWSDSHIACLAEIRMIWRDKNEHSILTGLRLYFLPENTPMGRGSHGEDEVVAISDKVVIRAEDLLNWFDEKLEWNWGLVRKPPLEYEPVTSSSNERNEIDAVTQDENISDDQEIQLKIPTSLKNSQINFADVDEEKQFADENFRTKIAVLSFPRYCRYRATLKRLEGVNDEWFKNSIVSALCGFSGVSSNLRIMFCRDTFDYPELETHELLCNHLAPKFKGRQRGRKKYARSESPFSGSKKSYDSESDTNESDISIFSIGNRKTSIMKPQPRSHLRYNHRPARSKGKSESETNKKNEDGSKRITAGYDKSRFLQANRPNRHAAVEDSVDFSNIIVNSNSSEETFFLRKLHEFHIRENNDIPQMLWLSLKDIHLYSIFRQVKKLGGYKAVTEKKLWRNLFGENNLNHLIITRRKYEKILLPLELSDVFSKKTLMKSSFSDNETDDNTSFMSTSTTKHQRPVNLRLKVKEGKSEFIDLDIEADISNEEMAKIQNKLKSKSPCLKDKNTDDVKILMNATDRKVSLPVTVIVGSQDSNDISSSDDDNDTKPIISSSTLCRKNTTSSQKIQIQQPHTTITVHQTTIHPQANSKKNSNQIQITNQIQIQQITVQPGRNSSMPNNIDTINETTSDFLYNIQQDPDKQEVKIERNNCGNAHVLRHVRVKNEKGPFEKENYPFIAAGTTITPVLSSNQATTSAQKKLPEIIDILDSDGETSPIKQAPPSQTSSQNRSRRRTECGVQDTIPPLKRRKLDILREGGLEVTAISNKHGVISSSVPLRIPNLNRFSGRTPNNSTKFQMPSSVGTTHPNLNASENISVPKISTNSMYTKTGKVFGNPKDIFPGSVHSNYCVNEERFEEVLDLTIKSVLKFSGMDCQSMPVSSARHVRSPPPLNLSTTQVAPKVPKLSENGLQITLVPVIQQQSTDFQPLTYTQNVHNSQNHNMKRKGVDITPITRTTTNSYEHRRSSSSSPLTLSDGTFINLSSDSPKPQQQAQSAVFPFPPFIPHMTNTPTPAHPFLPMFLSNLYGQTPNMFLSNQIPQELMQLYKNLPADIGMIPVSKS